MDYRIAPTWQLTVTAVQMFVSTTTWSQVNDPCDLQPGRSAAISFNIDEDINPCPDESYSWLGIEGGMDTIDDWNGGAVVHTLKLPDDDSVRKSDGGGAPASNWKERSTHPDVVRAVGFDSESEFNMGRFPDGQIAFNRWDTETKSSGNGSLQFIIPSRSGENTSGQWRMNFSEDPVKNPVTFGENEQFWVQWRQRFDPYFLEHVYRHSHGFGAWKQVIIGQGDGVANQEGYDPTSGYEVGSCTELELVMHNNSYFGYPSMYHGCGWFFPLETFANGDITRQSQFDCYYNDSSGCLPYRANEWMTFQIGLKIGAWQPAAVDSNTGETMAGFANSSIEFWIGYEGQPSVLAHRQTGLVFRRGNGTDDWRNAAHDAEYGKIWLTPYNAGKDGSEVHEEASTWYDELIISRSKIADPAGAPSGPRRTDAIDGSSGGMTLAAGGQTSRSARAEWLRKAVGLAVRP